MAIIIRRKKKKVEECDGGCINADLATGMGNVVPMQSGDRWDNVLGAMSTQAAYPKMKKRKNGRRKK